MTSQAKKKLIGNIVAAVLLVLFVSLTIVLLTMPVFNGKYSAENSETKTKKELFFKNNTYTLVVYAYHTPNSSYWYNDTQKEGYYLSNSYNGEYTYTPVNSSLVSSGSKNSLITLKQVASLNSGRIERINVFKLVVMQQGHSDSVMQEGDVYICVGAIALQVFYGIMLMADLIFLIAFNKHINKSAT